MPILLSRHPYPGAVFGLWLIEEPEEWFRADLPLSAAELEEYAGLKGIRRMEWLAARWLLHKLSGRALRLPLAKDAFSKPFFPDAAYLRCSLSHSQGVVGALLEQVDVPRPADGGCDIQVMVEKMRRIAPKFLSEEEARFVAGQPPERQFELLHVFWTAKESLYKSWGAKELDFRAHLSVNIANWDGRSGSGKGWIRKGAFELPYSLHFESCTLPDARKLIWTLCDALPEAG